MSLFRTSGLERNGSALGAIDGKPVLWENGFMKTTLELPDHLLKRVKLRAVHEHKKLKDAIAEFIERGMKQPQPTKLPKPLKLRGKSITTEEIEAAINWGRE